MYICNCFCGGVNLNKLCFRLQEYQVRILDAVKYEATQRLQQNCLTLISKVEQLNGLVQTYLKILDKQVCSAVSMFCSCTLHTMDPLQGLVRPLPQADKIEIEKLKAICVRNAVATLEEVQHDPKQHV